MGTGMRHVAATRYVLALREGGSLPGLVEADDLGMYVVKFRGAGQGRKALIAEIVTGELGRRLGLPVPELVVVGLDARLAPAEPDQEVQDLLRSSTGDNLGMDYLPGALGIESAVGVVDADLAARVVWFDGLTSNVDRSWHNPNLLRWHGGVWLIDHGASLYFHHNWPARAGAAAKPYPKPADHVLLPVAGSLPAAHEALAPQISPDLLDEVMSLVPDAWLSDEDGFATPADVRRAYTEVVLARAAEPAPWLAPMEEARRAQL